ncbi:MAG: TrkA family potassium uptake protein [Halolamina sp.]
MASPARRAGLYLVGTAVVMLLYAFIYQVSVAALQGVQISFLESLHVVVETFTTVGYGERANDLEAWPMLVLSMAMQLTGVALIFLTLPAFVLPLFAEAFESRPATGYEGEDHVIICTFSPTVEALVDELDTRDKDYVVIESDPARADSLNGEELPVVEGDPEDVDVMRAVNIGDADAVVAGADDETNASIMLAASHVAPDTQLLSLVEEESNVDYHRYAGADEVIQPRDLLGESLASKASSAVETSIGGPIEVGMDLDIAELLVQEGSPIEGRTIADCGIDEFTGTNIIGAWFRGEFVSPPDPDRVIDEHTILLVGGLPEEVKAMRELTLSESRRDRQGDVVVAGYGVVGSAVAEAVTTSGLSTTVIDIEDKPGVDVVGDVTEPVTLEEADLTSARSLVLAVKDDTTALFAALVAEHVASEVEIIARANDADSTPKLYRAGAEYVLSLPTVSGRMLASKLLDEEVITPETQVELVRMQAPALAGRNLGEVDVRARTNCTVLAVERDDEVLTGVGADLVVQADDVLVVAGNDEAIDAFAEIARG